MAETPEGQPVKRGFTEMLDNLTKNPGKGAMVKYPGLSLEVRMHHLHDDVFHMEVRNPETQEVVITEHNTPPEIAFRLHLLSLMQDALTPEPEPSTLPDEVEAFLASQVQK